MPNIDKNICFAVREIIEMSVSGVERFTANQIEELLTSTVFVKHDVKSFTWIIKTSVNNMFWISI